MYVKITCVPSSALINAMPRRTTCTLTSATMLPESKAASYRDRSWAWILICKQGKVYEKQFEIYSLYWICLSKLCTQITLSVK